MDTHKNARLTPKGREEMVRAVVEGGPSQAAAAYKFNTTPKTVGKWVKRFRAEGVDGLRDRSSRSLSSPDQTPQATCDAIEGLRRQRHTGVQIAAEVGVSPATVCRVLKRRGLNKLSALEPAEPVRRYEREKAGELIHLDIKKLGRNGSVGHRITGRQSGVVNRHHGIGWVGPFCSARLVWPARCARRSWAGLAVCPQPLPAMHGRAPKSSRARTRQTRPSSETWPCRLSAENSPVLRTAQTLYGSPDLQVLRGFFATVADDLILNRLPLIEGAQPCTLDGRNVNKHILTAALRLNKSISLGRVEPLYCSGSHAGLLASCALCNRARTAPSSGLAEFREMT